MDRNLPPVLIYLSEETVWLTRTSYPPYSEPTAHMQFSRVNLNGDILRDHLAPRFSKKMLGYLLLLPLSFSSL